MGDVKIRLESDSFRLYKYDEDGNIDRKRGFKRFRRGDEFMVPDFIADRLTGDDAAIVSPYGHVRYAAVRVGGSNDKNAELSPVNEQASQAPEADFGTTTIAGTLVSDPDGELADQRREARTMERTVQKDTKRPAHQNKSEG
jgi:hypothetical protein